MKHILLTLSAAVILLAACNSNKKDLDANKQQIVFTPDSSSLKQSNASTDVQAQGAETSATTVAPQTAPPQVRTVTKVVKVYEKQKAPVTTTPPVVVTPPATVPQSTTTAGTTTGETGNSGIPGSGTTGTTPAPAEKKNTGWSSAAKDATIGAVGGAVAGAVIGKGAKGAIIGGVIGAAGGYILGRKNDKKTGRVGSTTTTTTSTNP